MEYMSFIEALVNAQTEDERMELVKQHAETFAPKAGEQSDETLAQIEQLTATLDEANQNITALKQEIKDRFFSKFKEPVTETDPADTDTDKEADEPMGLKDLGFGNKEY